MNIFYFIRKSFKIQFNNFIAITPVAGYKFTNCYANKLQQLFWHVVLNFSLMVIIVIGLRFWYQYQNKSLLPVYGILEQGTKLPYPAVYLCLGYPLNPNSLDKYRKKFLKSNLTMTIKEIDYTLQTMLRFQRSAVNETYKLKELFRYNVDRELLRKNFNNLHYKINEVLKDCYFQGKRYDCDKLFTHIEMIPGACFVFNSIYSKPGFHINPRKQIFNEFSEFDDDWTIRFKILYGKNTALLMYLKDPRNILSLTDYPNYVWRPRKRIAKYGFNIEDRYSELNIKELKLSRRKCLFSDEKFPNKNLAAEFDTDFYNQDVCYNYCHVLKFIDLCQCMPTFGRILFPKLGNKTKICGFNEMECYEREYLNVRRTECEECYSNCNNTLYISKPEIQKPQNIKQFVKTPVIKSSLKLDFFEFTLDLEYWPVIQCRIINIFSNTEFLVALVSTASLFLGTSYITFIEAFYGLFIRYPCSYFVNRDYILKEIKKQEEIDLMKPIPCINISLKPGLKNY